uniref:Uncharacterized protein n=1 Tax=Knipowitschia caucasica TaxID=637954 RepID=A0AAV2L0R7_KNICA
MNFWGSLVSAAARQRRQETGFFFRLLSVTGTKRPSSSSSSLSQCEPHERRVLCRRHGPLSLSLSKRSNFSFLDGDVLQSAANSAPGLASFIYRIQKQSLRGLNERPHSDARLHPFTQDGRRERESRGGIKKS